MVTDVGDGGDGDDDMAVLNEESPSGEMEEIEVLVYVVYQLFSSAVCPTVTLWEF